MWKKEIIPIGPVLRSWVKSITSVMLFTTSDICQFNNKKCMSEKYKYNFQLYIKSNVKHKTN